MQLLPRHPPNSGQPEERGSQREQPPRLSGARGRLPRMSHGETPLLGDVAAEKHPAQEPGGVSRRNHRGELGRDGFPPRLGLLLLQQVFPQGFHKILVQPCVWTVRIIHLGYG